MKDNVPWVIEHFDELKELSPSSEENKQVEQKLSVDEYNKIQERVESLKEEEKQLTQRIEDLTSQYDPSLTKDQLYGAIHQRVKSEQEAEETLKARIKQYKAENEQAEEYKKQLQADLSRSNEAWMEKASGVMPFIDILSKRKHNNTDDIPQSLITMEDLEFYKCNSAKDIIDNIEEYLKTQNYKIERYQLYNYLTCIAQNFFTIFAGFPGVGKTVLSEYLGKILCTKNNFRLIPISRGWVSENDFLGYFNGISGTFEEARTGLVSDLNQLEILWNGNENDRAHLTSSFFILDEANLSSIEHYFSQFMPHCEVSSVNKSISIPNHKEINIVDGVRFIGTINVDHTTEILSPRLLDRVPIIEISSPDTGILFIDNNQSETSNDLTKVISYEDFDRCFGNKINQESCLPEHIKNNLMGIYKVLTDDRYGFPIPISHRQYKNISSFICRMAEYEELKDKNVNEQYALDMAVMQFILPKISGVGEQFQKRLEKLKEIINYLPQSTNRIDKIIINGERNHDNYHFFL